MWFVEQVISTKDNKCAYWCRPHKEHQECPILFQLKGFEEWWLLLRFYPPFAPVHLLLVQSWIFCCWDHCSVPQWLLPFHFDLSKLIGLNTGDTVQQRLPMRTTLVCSNLSILEFVSNLCPLVTMLQYTISKHFIIFLWPWMMGIIISLLPFLSHFLCTCEVLFMKQLNKGVGFFI